MEAKEHQREIMKMTNGRCHLVGVIGQWIAILFMLVGIIWVFATQSGNLDRVVTDVVEVKAAGAKTAVGLTDVEKAIIRIQSDMGHMKADIAEILLIQKQSLGILE